MRRRSRRIAALLGIFCIVVVASAHVGSPNVFFDGDAGPFRVRVVVRPPAVVPGLAQIVVRVPDGGADRVIVRPVYWRAGVRGAPEGDVARPVRGEPSTYAGELWLMQRGSYSVYVTVEGAAGSGEAIVPVMSVATGRLGLSLPLGAILGVLGIVLVVGMLTIVKVAAAESVLPPGVPIDERSRRRGRIAAVVAVPVLAFALLGGARWWEAVDADYQRSMYQPFDGIPRVSTEGGSAMLDLLVESPVARQAALPPIMPDHGKTMHMFLIGESPLTSFAHLHPVRTDSQSFRTPLPPLPAGRYRLFADVVFETGGNHTVATTLDLPAIPSGMSAADDDDGYAASLDAAPAARGSRAALGDGSTVEWTGDTALVKGVATDLSFTVRETNGDVASLQPYLGMAGHLVVMRDDGSVYIHLHPMGTAPVAAREVFILRDRGDTTPDGRLRHPGSVHDGMDHGGAMHGSLSFPYEFPEAGRYRVWIQVKRGGHVLTGAFDAVVRDRR